MQSTVHITDKRVLYLYRRYRRLNHSDGRAMQMAIGDSRVLRAIEMEVDKHPPKRIGERWFSSIGYKALCQQTGYSRGHLSRRVNRMRAAGAIGWTKHTDYRSINRGDESNEERTYELLRPAVLKRLNSGKTVFQPRFQRRKRALVSQSKQAEKTVNPQLNNTMLPSGSKHHKYNSRMSTFSNCISDNIRPEARASVPEWKQAKLRIKRLARRQYARSRRWEEKAVALAPSSPSQPADSLLPSGVKGGVLGGTDAQRLAPPGVFAPPAAPAPQDGPASFITPTGQQIPFATDSASPRDLMATASFAFEFGGPEAILPLFGLEAYVNLAKRLGVRDEQRREECQRLQRILSSRSICSDESFQRVLESTRRNVVTGKGLEWLQQAERARMEVA